MSTTTLQPLDASTNDNTNAGVPPAPPEPHQQAAAQSNDQQAGDQQASTVALRAQPDEGQPQYIALGALRLDERNVRKDPPTPVETQQLAELIDAQGLLQNLTVVAYAQPVKDKSAGKSKKRLCTHGVIAGGRRLRALFMLVEQGRLGLDEQVLCTVVPEERALAVSAAENSGRVPMSTADTVLAFADMVRQGAGVEDLAVCFGLSPLTVQRRLKLANVSPALFAMFRQEAMTLDQLMALALTDDHAAQEAAWAAAPEHDRSPRKLRALIVGEGLSHAVPRFVGTQAYEAAGGRVLRDLFAEGEDQPDYIQDAGLMTRLATEKLQGHVQGLRDERCAWVDTFLSFNYTEREQYAAVPSIRRAPTEQEAADLAELTTRAQTLDEQLEAAYDAEDDTDDAAEDAADQDASAGSDDDQPAREGTARAQIDLLESEAAEVATKVQAIEVSLRQPLPEFADRVGAVVYLDQQGEVRIERGLLRQADAAAAKRAAAKHAVAMHATTHGGRQGSAGSTQADSSTAEALPDKSGLSDRVCHQLTAHRTRALQASLLDNPGAALAALAHPLLARLVYGGAAQWDSPSAIKVSAEDCESTLKTWAPDLPGSRADNAIQEALKAAREMLPTSASDLLPWLLAQPVDTVTQLLTLCSALSLNAINGNGRPGATAALALTVKLDMADWWAPTEASFLGAVPKALIVQAVKEAGAPDKAEGLAKLKKPDAVKQAAVLLAGTRWLPSVLR